jgi:hypothetical protein
MPSELSLAVRGQTRPDPFVDAWDEVQESFLTNSGLEAKTVFDLQRQYPGRFQDGKLGTPQRRVKGWRATEGPAFSLSSLDSIVPTLIS